MLDRYPQRDPEFITNNQLNELTKAYPDAAQEVAEQMSPFLGEYVKVLQDSRFDEDPESPVPYLGDRHVHFIEYLKINKAHDAQNNEDINAWSEEQYRLKQYKQYKDRLAIQRGCSVLPEVRPDHRITYGFVAYLAERIKSRHEAVIHDISKTVFTKYVSMSIDQFIELAISTDKS